MLNGEGRARTSSPHSSSIVHPSSLLTRAFYRRRGQKPTQFTGPLEDPWHNSARVARNAPWKRRALTAPISFSFISVPLCLCERPSPFFPCRTILHTCPVSSAVAVRPAFRDFGLRLVSAQSLPERLHDWKARHGTKRKPAPVSTPRTASILVLSRRHRGTESFLDDTVDDPGNTILRESLAEVQQITAPISFSFISVPLCLCERPSPFFPIARDMIGGGPFSKMAAIECVCVWDRSSQGWAGQKCHWLPVSRGQHGQACCP